MEMDTKNKKNTEAKKIYSKEKNGCYDIKYS